MSRKKRLKQFWIDFDGSAMVEAKDKEEAKKKFWDGKYVYINNAPMSIAKIIGIEEVEEDIHEKLSCFSNG